MDKREIKRRIVKSMERTNENMERQKTIASGVCPNCGLSFQTGSLGNYIFYTCCSCQSYYVNIPDVPAPVQLEMIKYFVRDLRKVLKSEQRKKEELHRRHAEKLISRQGVSETTGNQA